MKYIKGKMLLPLNVYNELKEYLRKKVLHFNYYDQFVTVNKYNIKISIKEYSRPTGIYNQVSCLISIFSDESLISEKEIIIDRVSKLLLLFNIGIDNEYELLLYIDKAVPDTVEFAESKLNIMKWNISNDEYIRNYSLYADFTNERELMNVCYLLMANNNLLRNDCEFKLLIYNKLNYFGYTTNSIKYDLSSFNVILNTEDVLEKATGKVLYDISRIDDEGDYTFGIEEDFKNTAFELHKKYINFLKEEGKIY